MGNMCADNPYDKQIITKRKKDLASSYSTVGLSLGEYEENEVKEIK